MARAVLSSSRKPPLWSLESAGDGALSDRGRLPIGSAGLQVLFVLPWITPSGNDSGSWLREQTLGLSDFSSLFLGGIPWSQGDGRGSGSMIPSRFAGGISSGSGRYGVGGAECLSASQSFRERLVVSSSVRVDEALVMSWLVRRGDVIVEVPGDVDGRERIACVGDGM